MCLERSDGIRDGAEVPDDAVQVRIVEAEGRHSHADPRAKRDRPAQKRIEPVGLHARAFRRQHRRPQRGIAQQLHEIAAVTFDNVAADAVAATHYRPPPDQEIAARRTRRHGRRRLCLALEAHERRDQPVDFLIVEVVVRHPQLFVGQQHAAFVEDARIVELGAEPGELRGVRDVGDEREIEARHELAALFGQIRADRLRLLEPFDLVIAEAPVAGDGALAERNLLLLGIELRDFGFGILEGHHGLVVLENDPIDRHLIGRRLRRVAARPLQTGQVRGHVGHLLVGEPQVRHVGRGAVVLRIPDPVVDPLVRGLVADVLERLTEGAPRSHLGARALTHHMAALTPDRLDDLLTGFRVAAPRILDGELVLLGVREQIRGDGADLDLVSDRVLRQAVVRVVKEPRHPRRRLHRSGVPDPRLHPLR